MAHNLNEYKAGSFAYMGRQSAWHKLGHVEGDFFTWADICANGMMNFQVEKQQLQYAGKDVDAYGIFRSDNGAFLGAVGKDYAPIQHAVGFGMIDHLLGSIEGAHYETAGVLGQGEIVWGLANLAMAYEVVPGDVMKSYLMFSTAHNGSKAHEYKMVDERTVCHNTIQIAWAEKGPLFRVRHTKNANDRIDACHETVHRMRGQQLAMCDKLRALATRKVNKEAVESIFDRLFPKTAKDGKADESSTRRNNIMAGILARFESNDDNAFPVIRGSAYNLLNAITEYTDHDRSAKGGARAESALFGTGAKLKSEALEVITLAAGSMQPMTTTQYVTPRPAAPPPSSGASILDDILAMA